MGASNTDGQSRHKVDAFQREGLAAQSVVQSLARNGGVIIRNFLEMDKLQQISDDIVPYIEGRRGWKGKFFPAQTSRVTGLLAKSRAYADYIVMDSLWQEVNKAILTHHHFIVDAKGEKHESVALPQLSSTICFSIGPGAKAQVLHRDSSNSHQLSPEISAQDYQLGRDDQMSIFVAAKKTTRANGATRFVPGSHLQATHTPPPDEDIDPEAAFYAELEPGDAFIMLGSSYHGGSANTTTNEERLVYAAFATKGYLRQEENQYLVLSVEDALKYPDSYLKHFGYAVAEPFTGWLDFSQPYTYLRTGGVPQYEDLSMGTENAPQAVAV